MKHVAWEIEENEDRRHQKQGSSDVKLGVLAPGSEAQVVRHVADRMDIRVVLTDAGLVKSTFALNLNSVQ